MAGSQTFLVNISMSEMSGVLSHGSALKGYTGPGTTWANKMKLVMNHAPGAGLITQPIDQQSSAYHCTTDAHTINL